MPFPNFHSARIKDPGGFENIVVLKTLPNGVMIYGGRLKGEEKTSEQSYRFPKDKFSVQEAKAWLTEHKVKYILFEPASEEHSEEPAFYELKDIDVAVEGKWKGKTYTSEMLDNMVTAFNELKGKVNVKFKLDHDEEQRIVKNSGLPNIGTINNLRKAGDRIKAHIIRIPRKVMDLINVKAYNEISPEINPSYYDSTSGKTYKNILWNVALLGAKHKAMNTLKDIHDLFFADKQDFKPEYSSMVLEFAEPLIMEDEDSDKEKAKLKEEEVKKMKENEEKIKEFEEKNAQLTKDLEDSNAKVTALEKEKKEVQEKLDKFAQDEADEKINEFIEKNIKEGKILPAQKKNIFTMISAKGSETVKFTVEENGKKVEKEGTMIDLYEAILNSVPFNLVKMSEETVQETDDKVSSDEKKKMEAATGMDVVDDDIDQKAKKYAEEHDVPYEEALDKVT